MVLLYVGRIVTAFKSNHVVVPYSCKNSFYSRGIGLTLKNMTSTKNEKGNLTNFSLLQSSLLLKHPSEKS